MVTALPLLDVEIARSNAPDAHEHDLHPVLRAMARAPVDDEPLDPELEVEYARRAQELRSGRVEGVPHELVHEKLTQMARERSA